MPTLLVSDNNRRGRKLSEEERKQHQELLEKFSGKTLENLSKENPNVIICPSSQFQSAAQESSEETKQNIWDYADGTLRTNNIVGILGDGQSSIFIQSRFDSGEKQYFLHYLLAKVFAPTVLESDLDYRADNILDLLPYLLAPLYQHAHQQYGLYREYRSLKCNDSRPQGRIDIARHIKENPIENGKLAYTKRQHEYDNRITQLLRHTIEQIRFRGFQIPTNSNRELTEALRELVQHVPDARRNQTQQILGASDKAIRSPYATAYEELRKLCRAILQRQKLSLQGQNPKNIHGILFDIAWLWEEYLATLMPPEITHSYASQEKGRAIYQGQASPAIYPDFYSIANHLVMDAKYKHMENNSVNRRDRYQMISYLYILEATKGILLYPCEKTEPSNFCGYLNGYGKDQEASLASYGFPVPQIAQENITFKQFSEQMRKSEEKFQTYIEEEK